MLLVRKNIRSSVNPVCKNRSQVRKITFKQFVQAFQYFLKHCNNTYTICLKIVCGLGILFAGVFLTLLCDSDTTYNQSFFSDDYLFCSLHSQRVCTISGWYTRDFYPIFAYFLRILRMSRWTFLVPNESHNNHWREREK